jgi:hypothetical protein
VAMMTSTGRVAIVAVILAILSIGWYWAANNSAYKELKIYLAGSPEIQSRVGSIKSFHLVTLSNSTDSSDEAETAMIGLYAVGTLGRVNICANLRKFGERWNVTTVYLNGSILSGNGREDMDEACIQKVAGTIAAF